MSTSRRHNKVSIMKQYEKPVLVIVSNQVVESITKVDSTPCAGGQ